MTARQHEGRLELTWSNKHLRLHTTSEGEYEWVEPTDPRVTEVRLIDELDRVGEPDPDLPNLLIRGDALHALTSLNRIPALADRYAGKVRLVYIDPPFNTGQAFAHYDDNLEHSVWLSMLRDRLEQIAPLLAPNGSVWVHLDDAEVHRCRLVMDEVLGTGSFIATMVWQRRFSRSNDAQVSTSHDYILVYGPSGRLTPLNPLPASEGQLSRYNNPDSDPRGPWVSVSFNAPNIRPNLTYEIVGPSGRVHVPPAGRCWSTTEAEFQRLRTEDRIYFGADGNGVPRLKRYLAEVDTSVRPWTWWPHDEVGNTQESAREIAALGLPRFATPKPERLLSRIITIASEPGDVVLDCFAGSGTTPAVAHKLGRSWVAVEREAETLDTLAVPRLTMVVTGQDTGGVSEAAGWQGGGGFTVAEVCPSMFDLDLETGDVYMAEWATNGWFASACAAHLGFPEERSGPFVGARVGPDSRRSMASSASRKSSTCWGCWTRGSEWSSLQGCSPTVPRPRCANCRPARN